MKLTNRLANKNTAFRRCSYCLIVFSSAMLAAWTLGEMFSVGGFTALEMGLLVLFSSTVLGIAAAFWNAVISFAVQLLPMEPLILADSIQPQVVSNHQN